MNNITVKMLEPSEWYLLEEFCAKEGIRAPSPDFGWVVAGIEDGRIVGVVVAQMQIHTEPIWIEKEYQGKGLKEQMMDLMEMKIDEASVTKGQTIHVYAEPTNAASEKICKRRGFVKSERCFYTKVYGGESFVKLFLKGD